MGDIYCRVCGELWDSYGVHHHEDMTPEEAKQFLAGKGCPCCKGKPVYDCKLDNGGLPSTIICEHLEGKCKYEGKCDHKIRRRPLIDDFLESLTDSANTDEDPIELLHKSSSSALQELY